LCRRPLQPPHSPLCLKARARLGAPIFFGDRPSGPILGASDDAAPTSPPVARTYTSTTWEGSNLGAARPRPQHRRQRIAEQQRFRARTAAWCTGRAVQAPSVLQQTPSQSWLPTQHVCLRSLSRLRAPARGRPPSGCCRLAGAQALLLCKQPALHCIHSSVPAYKAQAKHCALFERER